VDILVKRFTVKHNGKHYGPGDIICNVPDESGRKIVNESNGEMEELPAREPIESPINPESQTNPETTEIKGNDTGEALIPIDPKKTVGADKK